MPNLGVNIDHIANVRQARRANEPNPVSLAFLAELGGADGITVHLREDRRHIQDKDLELLRKTISTRLNLEMAATQEMLDIAIRTKPYMVTLVPEKREEVTTEGGLNVISQKEYLKEFTRELQSKDIPVSLFIDPSLTQIDASNEINCKWIELHTGKYASATNTTQLSELSIIKEATIYATSLGLRVNAGHGLTYQNVEPIASIKGIEELNIGHTIISRSIATGLKEAVREMKLLILNPREDRLINS
ncbi:pyridoxine 5'-phosphate synthase [Prochlorococcus sp. MIT 1223]|uniref:pyridoxine 5'-phosphate synthase n=1 Tax=Prochlorococcus sp. MIT 1223 TaxID=3096217 RepID=UPI002A760183|nr:pyridoxine 5'-phosphate synthase [Prochlorococcus sp. MIT 1223]